MDGQQKLQMPSPVKLPPENTVTCSQCEGLPSGKAPEPHSSLSSSGHPFMLTPFYSHLLCTVGGPTRGLSLGRIANDSAAIQAWKLPPTPISVSPRPFVSKREERGSGGWAPRPPLLTAKANPESLVTPQGHWKMKEHRCHREVSPAHQKGPSSRDTPKASETS